MSVVQSVLVFTLFLGMFSYLLFWLLLWAKLPVERLALGSIGVVGTSTALYLIGTAVRPNRQQGQCNPASRGDSLARGPLTLIGVGLWFLVGGTVFFNRALFLGVGDLPKYAVWLVVGTMAAAFVLVMTGSWYDRRRFEVARVAVRRRGWSMASRKEDEDLSAIEAQRRQLAREELGRTIHRHLTGRTTLERVQTQHRYLVSMASAAVSDEWLAFRSAFADRDEVWSFKTLPATPGPTSSEEGFARLRDGIVMDWFVTSIVE
jgi:hypothetical protein